MPPRASNSTAAGSATSSQGRTVRVVHEIVWGRPVFRPPELGFPQAAIDPLPFQTSPAYQRWKTAGR